MMVLWTIIVTAALHGGVHLDERTAGNDETKTVGADVAIADADIKSSWTAAEASHLLRRAGFGGTPEQIAFLVTLGREKAVDYLVDYEVIPYEVARPNIVVNPPSLDSLRLRDMTREERQKAASQIKRLEALGLREISSWWIQRMVATPRPLEEKMVLFWHGHFTSGFREIKQSSRLGRQNEMFRRLATGNYREMILNVCRDPAMLAYLNNDQNNKRKPNENFARELLELFTLGEGRYSEQDIKEAARAFTGWTARRSGGSGFTFEGRQHDWDEKTFLGKTGNFDGTDIVDIILRQPELADHLVRRLWWFFAGEKASDEIVIKFARVFRSAGYEIKPLLKAMFASDEFYRSAVMHTQVRSPVDLLIGTLRCLEVVPEDSAALSAAVRLMGQELFQPPNVKGWDGGLTWINTATLFNRYNTLGYIVHGTPQRDNGYTRQILKSRMMAGTTDDGEMASDDEAMMNQMDEVNAVAEELLRNQPPFEPAAILKKYKLTTAEQIVDHFVARLLQQKITSDRRAVLIDELKRVAGEVDIDSPYTIDAVRGVIHLIVSMPEYQLG